MAPGARGLFHRGIIQSIAHMSFLDPDLATEVAETFMRFAGAADIASLEALPIDVLLAAQRQTLRTRPPWLKIGFQPRFGDSVLARDILPAARDGEMLDIPVMVGTTSDEWNPFAFFMNPDDIPSTDGEAIALLDRIMGDGEARMALYRSVRGPMDALDTFNAITGDWRWWVPTLRFAETVADKQPVYHYEFAWKSPTHDGRLRAGHCVELPFTFHNLHTPSSPYLIGGSPPVALADRMHAAWIAFVRTGNPSTPELGEWPRYDMTRRATMTFDTDCALVDDPRPELREHWLAA